MGGSGSGVTQEQNNDGTEHRCPPPSVDCSMGYLIVCNSCSHHGGE